MKKLKHITKICEELYNSEGAGAVYDHANEFIEKQGDSNVHYRNHCKGCEANTPSWHDTCLVCGQPTEPLNFKVVHTGFNKEAGREEVQIHYGEHTNIFLIKTDEGFIVDVYGQDDVVATMAVWDDDLNPDED